MKCKTCKHMDGYTLGFDEVGAGNTFLFCVKGHWEDGYVENTNKIWDDCTDYKANIITPKEF